MADLINIGTVPNDGTGDDFRTVCQKINGAYQDTVRSEDFLVSKLPDATPAFKALNVLTPAGQRQALSASAVGNTPVSDADYQVLATDVEVAYTTLTTARTVKLCDVDTYTLGQDLVIGDKTGACSAANRITIRVGDASGDTIPQQPSGVIVLASPYASVRLRRGAPNTWNILSIQGPVNGASFRNRALNGAFWINQRNVAAASTAYPAFTFTRDRWKAGSGGVTVSFSTAASGDGTASITAGTLVQVIEGITLPEGGGYTLSWSGTALARVNGGAYAASPIATPGLTPGASVTIEFSTGTVGLVQFEPGFSPSTFERRDDELRRCQRYCRPLGGIVGAWGGATTVFDTTIDLSAAPMRAPPTAVLVFGSAAIVEPNISTRDITQIFSTTFGVNGGRMEFLTTAGSSTFRTAFIEPGAIRLEAEI